MIAPAHGDHGRIIEKARHALDLQRRGGDDQLKIGPARQHALHHAQEQVDVERALVRLIHDDGVIAPQQGIRGEFREQQTVGHQYQARGRRHLVGEANSKSDRRADRLRQLFGDAGRQCARRQPARLGVRDQPSASALELEAVLRQLGALAGAGIAGDDQDLVTPERIGDFLTARGNRQFGAMFEIELRQVARS